MLKTFLYLWDPIKVVVALSKSKAFKDKKYLELTDLDIKYLESCLEYLKSLFILLLLYKVEIILQFIKPFL